MSYRPITVDREGEKSTFLYRGIDREEFPQRLERFFHHLGYRLEHGAIHNGILAKKEKVLRSILVAWPQRYTFEVKLVCSGNSCRVDLAPFAGGKSGGMTMSRAFEQETRRLVEKIRRTEL